MLLSLLVGCGTSAEGPFALAFDGGEDCVQVDLGGLAPPDALTVEAWVRGDPEAGDAPRPIVEWKGAFSLGQVRGGDLAFVVGENEGASYGTSVVDGVLHHVAGTWNGEEASIYVDGARKSFADAAAPADATSTLRLGCNAAVEGYQGLLDEVRVSSTVRYTEDFTPVGPYTADDDTVLLFHFDEGTGDTTVDEASGLVGDVFGAEWIAFDVAAGEG